MVYNSFIATFKPLEYVCCYENKNLESGFDVDDFDNEQNPHIHVWLKYDKVPTKQKVSEFFKKQPIIKKGTVAGYYHRAQIKTTEANVIYTVKHGH